jgi:large subunit ribosomal protein L24
VAGLFVKKGDTVQVIAGKDKGVKGRVISVNAERQRVLVEGVARVKKHTKITQSTRGSQQGGIVTQESAVHVSNVQIVDPKDGRPTRVGFRFDDDGRKVRFSKRSGEEI